MTVLLKCRKFISRGHKVTLISPHPYQYYSGMGPGMLSGIYRPQEIRFNVQKMVEDRGGFFIQDRIKKVDPAEKRLLLESGQNLSYDVLSLNVGSTVTDNAVNEAPGKVYPVKPILNLLKARERILEWPADKRLNVVVAGGGASGVEVAGNIWRLTGKRRDKTEITLIAGRRLLKRFPDNARLSALKSLRRRGVDVLEGIYLERSTWKDLMLSNGKSIGYDLLFHAPGVAPPPVIRDSGLPADTTGAMLVNNYLQSVTHTDIFGGGDCITLEGHSLNKVGVYAVRQNPVLYKNLLASLEGRKLKSFDPGGTYLLILNMGDGRGLFCRASTVWEGRLAFTLKDFIDRRFMRRFQVSGERRE